MGLTFSRLDGSDGPSLLAPTVRAVLDLGLTNVYDCQAERLWRLLQQRGIDRSAELVEWVEEFSRGSGVTSAGDRLNEAYLGGLCDKLGVRYVAIDIFEDPHTIILDLNRDDLPPALHGAFDLVINSGTSEHVMNQFNAFRIMHDAVRVGGETFHVLPVSGHTDHGYVHYTSRFFFDLAGYNSYKLIEIGYDCVGGSDLLDTVRKYRDAFREQLGPVLETGVRIGIDAGRNVYGPEPQIPDASIILRYQKVLDQPFLGALDAATSVGETSDLVKGRYIAAPIPAATDDGHPALTAREAAGLDRLFAGVATLEEALEFYRSVVDRVGSFPLEWEVGIVRLSLERDPGRPDLLERLRITEAAAAAKGLPANGGKPPSPIVETGASAGEPGFVAPLGDLPAPQIGYSDVNRTLAFLAEQPSFQRLAAYFDRASPRSLLSAIAQAHLYTAILNLKPSTVVEIGTYHAGTSETIARALASNGIGVLHTMSPHDGERIRRNIAAWPRTLAERVVYHETNSAGFFQNFTQEARHVDICLIDGNHDLEFVLFDLFATARCASSRALVFLDNISQPGVYRAVKTFLQSYPEWSFFGLPGLAGGSAELFDGKRSTIQGTDFAILQAPRGPVLLAGRCHAPGLRRTAEKTVAGIQLLLREPAGKPTRIVYQVILRETASLVEKTGSGCINIDAHRSFYQHYLDSPLSVVDEAAGGEIYVELVLAIDDDQPVRLLLEDEPRLLC